MVTDDTDGPIKHMFKKTVDRAVGTGTRAKLARLAADNAIWMPVSTCLFFAVLKLAQGEPEEIVSSCQVSHSIFTSALLQWWPCCDISTRCLTRKVFWIVA